MHKMLKIIAKVILKMRLAMFRKWLAANENCHFETSPKLLGVPYIDVKKGCRLDVGENVTLNSLNEGYHINMHSPVKIMADHEGAEISIGKNTRINGACIHARKNISIGDNCLIAANTHIIDNNGHNISFENVANRINTRGTSKSVVIEDNVWIGANCFILPGAIIRNGAVVSANSVVSGEVPSKVIVAGNPAAIIISADKDD